MADRVIGRVKKKTTQFRGIFVLDHCVPLFQRLSNHMHFIINGHETLFKDQLDRSKAMVPLSDSPENKAL